MRRCTASRRWRRCSRRKRSRVKSASTRSRCCSAASSSQAWKLHSGSTPAMVSMSRATTPVMTSEGRGWVLHAPWSWSRQVFVTDMKYGAEEGRESATCVRLRQGFRSRRESRGAAMGDHRIAVLPGDGVGREVAPEAVRILDTVMEHPHMDSSTTTSPAVVRFEETGLEWEEGAWDRVKNDADAIFLGAIGLPGARLRTATSRRQRHPRHAVWTRLARLSGPSDYTRASSTRCTAPSVRSGTTTWSTWSCFARTRKDSTSLLRRCADRAAGRDPYEPPR